MDGPLVGLDLYEVDVSRVRSLPHVLCRWICIYGNSRRKMGTDRRNLQYMSEDPERLVSSTAVGWLLGPWHGSQGATVRGVGIRSGEAILPG